MLLLLFFHTSKVHVTLKMSFVTMDYEIKLDLINPLQKLRLYGRREVK